VQGTGRAIVNADHFNVRPPMSDYWKEMGSKSVVANDVKDDGNLYPLNKTLVRRAKTGAYWCWLLAGVSAFNILFAYARAPVRLSLGLMVTDLMFAVGRSLGPLFTILALALISVVVIVVALLGIFATRFKTWAFVAAIVIVSVDTVLIAIFYGLQSISGFVIHLFAAYSLYVGFKSAKLYSERKKSGQA